MSNPTKTPFEQGFDHDLEPLATQTSAKTAEKSKNKKSLSERIPKSKYGKITALGGLVVIAAFGVKGLNGLGVNFGIENKSVNKVPPPEVTVTKIEPINIGCFAKVDSSVHLKVNEHKTTNLVVFGKQLASKQWWTNTAEAKYDGEGMLCVDNKDTSVTVTKNNKTGFSKMDVSIGNLYSQGSINHNGHDGPEESQAIGQRVGNLFRTKDDAHVASGMALIAQTVFRESGCLTDAVPVAKKQISNYYAGLAKTIGGITPDYVHVSYKDLPPPQRQLPEGVINTQLEDAGLSIPSDWGIESTSPGCKVTIIDGQPAVTK